MFIQAPREVRPGGWPRRTGPPVQDEIDPSDVGDHSPPPVGRFEDLPSLPFRELQGRGQDTVGLRSNPEVVDRAQNDDGYKQRGLHQYGLAVAGRKEGEDEGIARWDPQEEVDGTGDEEYSDQYPTYSAETLSHLLVHLSPVRLAAASRRAPGRRPRRPCLQPI